MPIVTTITNSSAWFRKSAAKVTFYHKWNDSFVNNAPNFESNTQYFIRFVEFKVSITQLQLFLVAGIFYLFFFYILTYFRVWSMFYGWFLLPKIPILICVVLCWFSYNNARSKTSKCQMYASTTTVNYDFFVDFPYLFGWDCWVYTDQSSIPTGCNENVRVLTFETIHTSHFNSI